MVLEVSYPADEASRLGSVDQADDTVVAEEEVVGDLADGGCWAVAVTSYRQEQLVLGRREASGTGLALAPAFEVAKPGAQCEQSRVSRIGQGHPSYDVIWLRSSF